MLHKENSEPLESTDPEIKKIWDRVVREGYKPELYDIIKIYFRDTRGKYYGGLVFFIDNNGIYVSDGYFYAPDAFYDFLERLGLGGSFHEYIYRNCYPSFRHTKWPYMTSKKEKL